MCKPYFKVSSLQIRVLRRRSCLSDMVLPLLSMRLKAQIIKHYQRISDREAFVTAEMVRNAYQGIGSEYETLLKAFDRLAILMNR